MAANESLCNLFKSRPFVYVTRNGEPPEIDAQPFKSMECFGFVVDCEPEILCNLCKLPGVRALEIRRQRIQPVGYRVRLFHEDHKPDISLYLDPDTLYDMATVRARSGSTKGKKN